MKTITVNNVEIPLTDELIKAVNEAQKQPEQTKEELFASFVSQVDVNRPVVDFEKYPDSMFWFNKEGKYLFEYNWETGFFWINYDLIWSVFERQFNMNYDSIKEFMTGMVEEHFKLKGVTPEYRFINTMHVVEEHFKNLKEK